MNENEQTDTNEQHPPPVLGGQGRMAESLIDSVSWFAWLVVLGIVAVAVAVWG